MQFLNLCQPHFGIEISAAVFKILPDAPKLSLWVHQGAMPPNLETPYLLKQHHFYFIFFAIYYKQNMHSIF